MNLMQSHLLLPCPRQVEPRAHRVTLAMTRFMSACWSDES